MARSRFGALRRWAAVAPASFGAVMATGIVSLGANLFRMPVLAWTLFVLNFGLYLWSWLSLVARWRVHAHELASELSDHRRGPGFFTIVAGSGLLGSQLLTLAHSRTGALALWVVTALCWCLLTYAVFAALTIKADKPPLGQSVSGTWLLAVVATQSLAVLSASLAPVVEPPLRLGLITLSLCLWLWGVFLYTVLIGLIVYRLLFIRLSPAEFTSPYWINMGAMAISTLAGSVLTLEPAAAPLLVELGPFIRGATLLCWAVASWWIPLLLVLGAWRYVGSRFPLRYDAQYWSVVFPLGMYAVATHEMSRALSLDFLIPLSIAFLAAAALAWLLVATACVRAFLAPPPVTPPEGRGAPG